VAAPATVSGEPLVHNGHWETGKAGRAAKTREPGDLPARSPNRWTRGPYGAVFRSGDVDACCEGRESEISHDFEQNRDKPQGLVRSRSFAAGLVSPDARRHCVRKRRNVLLWG
jgi:hypothetical protein